ncbi:MAG: SulP family inorganic anion transporter [Candidatus Moranbacteria bacterium]|nr:SulP family inorganic anion transporter [Candidatus Moranbacteria bacterium]
MPKLERIFPFIKWKNTITRASLQSDIIAGFIGAVIVLPQGVAFATIAGLPPEYGLYSAIVPAIIAALWGSSRHLVSGPTTAISLVVFASISPLASVGTAEYVKLALTLTFVVGLIQLLMGWMKVGKLLNFISHTVVVGFTAGASILIMSSQIKNFFGISVPQGSSFYETIHIFITKFDTINHFVLIVGLATLLSGIIIKKFWPKFPYMIPAMLVGSLVGLLMNDHFGFGVTGIKTVGALPAALPPLSMPSFDPAVLRQIASPALAITMLALTEAIAISRAVALRSGQRIDGNQEVIGQGMSNLVGSFFSAYPASGSFNRSGLNYESGAKTPLASIFAAVFLGIIILFVASLAKFLPVAVMAGILFLVAWGLIDFRHIRHIARSSKGEIGLLLVTFLSTLFLELEFAIFVGVFLSVTLYLRRTSKPLVICLTPDPSHPNHKFIASCDLPKCPQLSIIKIDGAIFFGSVSNIEQELGNLQKRYPDQKNLLIVFSGVSSIDLAGIDMLIEQMKIYRGKGGDLYISNVNKPVYEKLQKYGLVKALGEGNIFNSKPDAIKYIVEKLDAGKCKECPHKIFYECGEKIK